MDETQFTHLDDQNRPRMVDVSGKPLTQRTARAEARVRLVEEVAKRIEQRGSADKGNVIDTARIAGIMGAKRTAELIPMCHGLLLDEISLEFDMEGCLLVITAEVRCTGRTGVEMEAMTAAAIAALTVYDMCKSVNKGIVIESIRLLKKTGGRSGEWTAPRISCLGE